MDKAIDLQNRTTNCTIHMNIANENSVTNSLSNANNVLTFSQDHGGLHCGNQNTWSKLKPSEFRTTAIITIFWDFIKSNYPNKRYCSPYKQVRDLAWAVLHRPWLLNFTFCMFMGMGCLRFIPYLSSLTSYAALTHPLTLSIFCPLTRGQHFPWISSLAFSHFFIPGLFRFAVSFMKLCEARGSDASDLCK